MKPFPRISVITPSLNHARFVGTTIESVLSQGYPDLEYIVIDGGSTDGTVDVIRRNEAHLAHWESERDRGQSHALNKGLARATGDVVAFLNSDDYYLPGALRAVGEVVRDRAGPWVIHGACEVVNEDGVHVRDHLGRIEDLAQLLDLWSVWWQRRQWVQPEVFWTRSVLQSVGPFDERLHLALDYEYWVRALAAGARIERLERPLAAFRLSPNQKSSQRDRAAGELLSVVGDWLWRPGLAISRARRLELQAQWLYHTELLRSVEESERRRRSRPRRWARILATMLRHPKIVLAPGFRERVRATVL